MYIACIYTNNLWVNVYVILRFVLFIYWVDKCALRWLLFQGPQRRTHKTE